MDGTGPRISINRKILHLADTLLQANVAASSGLRENVYFMNFLCQNVGVYNIIIFIFHVIRDGTGPWISINRKFFT